MVGGLLQLVSTGGHDIYLTGNPQMTFFKVVYRRHTNFSIESILQIFSNKIISQSETTCNIGRKGDLIYKMYIQQEIPTSVALTSIVNYGYDFIKTINVKIGSQIIDEHTNNWLETWAELTQPNEYGNFTSASNALFMNNGSNEMGLTSSNGSLTATRFQSLTMAGGVDGFPESATISPINDGNYSKYLSENKYHYIYTPLQFWFCKNIGLALPLIALQYNEVTININFNNLINTNFSNPELYIDYIFLDTDERKRFAQISHEYLIEQLQIIQDQSNDSINLIHLNNPVKELIWVSGNGTQATYNNPLYGTWNIQINGYDRFSKRDITYFTKQQIFDHHSGYGGVTKRNSIAVYSFCLNPEDHQPSGTINFSTIQNSYLIRQDRDKDIDIADKSITVYAINYNILRILSGQGNLAYSN